MSFRGIDPCADVVVLAASACLAATAPAGTPPAYSLEQRHFYGRPDDPNPVAKIYVAGDRHRMETYVDGKLRSIEISRPDRNVVYLIDESARTWTERPFGELRARGWSPGGGFSRAEYQERARKGGLVFSPLGAETVDGQACEKYAIVYGKSPPGQVQAHFWVSVRTGLPVLWRSELFRDSKARIEWSNLKVAPQPAELFEPPRSYSKVRPVER